MTGTRRLLSSSSVIVAGRLSGAAIIFAMQALIARQLGSETLGQYMQVAAAINIAAVVLPLGFQVIASYFAVEYATRGQGSLLRCFLAQAYGQALLLAALVFSAGLIAKAWDWEVTVLDHWAAMSIMSAACALVFVSGATLAALRRPVIAFLGDGLFRPLITSSSCVLALWLVSPPDALGTMLWTMALSYAAVAAIYVVLTSAAVFKVEGGEGSVPVDARRWWRFALPWTIIALATEYLFELQIMLLSGLMGYADLAVFGAVARIFTLAAFAVSVIYTVTLPDVFKAEAMNDREGFSSQVFRTNLAATAFGVCAAAGAVMLSPLVLGIFGPEFAQGRGPLAVLCLALVLRSAFGPSALILSVHDRPYAALPAVALGMAAMAAGSWLMVPPFGVYGAAFAAALAIGLWSVAMWWTALRLTGVNVSIFAPLFTARRRARAA